MNVLLSIHHKHAENILSKIKLIEIRKTIPMLSQIPFTVYLYETKNSGGIGQITGEFTCDGYDYPGDSYHFVKDSCLTESQLLEYMGETGHICGWRIINPIRYKKSIPINNKPPQSWRYVKYGEECYIQYGLNENVQNAESDIIIGIDFANGPDYSIENGRAIQNPKWKGINNNE